MVWRYPYSDTNHRQRVRCQDRTLNNFLTLTLTLIRYKNFSPNSNPSQYIQTRPAGRMAFPEESLRLKSWVEPSLEELAMVLQGINCTMADRIVGADLVGLCLAGTPLDLPFPDKILPPPSHYPSRPCGKV